MFKFQWQLVTCLTLYLASVSTNFVSELSHTDHEILAAKVARLESLEHEFQELKELLKAIQSKDRASTDLVTQSVGKATGKIYRTCRDTRSADPSLASGMYYVDPDGENIGDSPIYVYCDMSTGATSVPHDTETKTDVGHCADPGCYSKTITYPNATMRQMAALADSSTECHQSIRYDCNFAPFEANGVTYSWWNDRNGIARYFWAGANSSVHTCQCGIDRNCVDSFAKCNCDALAPVDLADDGVITDKNLLPITRLNFGRTQLSSSTGAHTLGRFTCSGQFIFTGTPTTCTDLSLIGHTLSGFYSVKGKTSQQVETVYCNFNKLPSETGYETRVGFPELKSSPTYFSVKRNVSTSSGTTGPVTFQVEQLNIGGAMNLTSGRFMVPRTGTYFFAFSGVTYSSSSDGYLEIELKTSSGRNLGETYVFIYANSKPTTPIGIEAIARLSAGEQVYLNISAASHYYLYETGTSNYNQFNGWLLQEDLS